MALNLISYDIAEKDRGEYSSLWDFLERLGAAKILYSEYIVQADTRQARSLAEKISPLIRRGDRLLVIEVTKDAGWLQGSLMVTDDIFDQWRAHARG